MGSNTAETGVGYVVERQRNRRRSLTTGGILGDVYGIDDVFGLVDLGPRKLRKCLFPQRCSQHLTGLGLGFPKGVSPISGPLLVSCT